MDLQRLESLFKALGNKTRLKILIYLKNSGERDTGSIADFLEKNYKTAIPHLERLVKAQLISRKREGLIINYKITKLGLKVLSQVEEFYKGLFKNQ